MRIIGGYLEDVGATVFVPRAFLEWLSERPDHEVYSLFFGLPDADAAAAYREGLVRQWVSDLRITVEYTEPELINLGMVEITEYTLPAMFSPIDGRRGGGGYERTDAAREAHRAELRRQGAAALVAWLDRYGGLARLAGADVAAIEAAAEMMA
jgi:hypothetical protein